MLQRFSKGFKSREQAGHWMLFPRLAKTLAKYLVVIKPCRMRRCIIRHENNVFSELQTFLFCTTGQGAPSGSWYTVSIAHITSIIGIDPGNNVPFILSLSEISLLCWKLEFSKYVEKKRRLTKASGICVDEKNIYPFPSSGLEFFIRI